MMTRRVVTRMARVTLKVMARATMAGAEMTITSALTSRSVNTVPVTLLLALRVSLLALSPA